MIKSDVPFWGTPAGYAVTGVVMTVAYSVILIKEPHIRPGLIELLVAMAFGFPIGLLVGKVWIAYLQQISARIPSQPFLKWIGHLFYPMVPLGPQTSFRLVLAAAWLCGLAFIYLALASLHPIIADISEPWTRLGKLTVWEDTAVTILPFFFTWLGTLMVIGLRWYNSLED